MKNKIASLNEIEIEQEIKAKGLNAPRLCPDDIDAVIVGESYTVLPSGKAMVCEITLRNGFTVRGESACVSNENFNFDIGAGIAHKNARDKIWELEGYRLQERNSLYRSDYQKIVKQIAEACHEVNKEYCRSIGDDSQVSWNDAPAWQQESAILGVQLHLDKPGAGPQASHESWMSQKIFDGWKYGPIKDAEAKEHPCLVPFADLPMDQQAKDYIFRSVVHAMAKILLN